MSADWSEEQRMQADEEYDDDTANDYSQERSTSSPQPVDNSQVYQAFGRDTAAGRALFKLYNKNKVAYAPNVAIHTRPTDPLAEAAEKRRREAAALKKKVYQPPKLKKAEKEPEVGRVPLWGGKKTSETIDREKQLDTESYKAPSIPLAQLQHRENEKKKLQEAHMKKNTANGPSPLPGRGRPVPVAKARDPNQELYDKIIEEIEERHQFLDSMRAMGDLSHEATIKAEIAHRLRDLKKLEALIADPDSVMPSSAPAAAATRLR